MKALGSSLAVATNCMMPLAEKRFIDEPMNCDAIDGGCGLVLGAPAIVLSLLMGGGMHSEIMSDSSVSCDILRLIDGTFKEFIILKSWCELCLWPSLGRPLTGSRFWLSLPELKLGCAA